MPAVVRENLDHLRRDFLCVVVCVVGGWGRGGTQDLTKEILMQSRWEEVIKPKALGGLWSGNLD